MKKIIVIGCPGSGKTTFSQKLSEKLGIRIFYLDAIWHKEDRTHISRDEFDLALGEILKLGSWIIDGNYSRTLERRMSCCDTVIFFDLPTRVCIDGAQSRIGKKRCDIPWVDSELDPEFLREIEEFKDRNLPAILELLDKYKDSVRTFIFKSREEADAFLALGEAREV